MLSRSSWEFYCEYNHSLDFTNSANIRFIISPLHEEEFSGINIAG
jgi:hypothetical protein